MNQRPRLFPIFGIFFLVSVSWMALSGTMLARSSAQEGALARQVDSLWGQPQTQRAPEFVLHWTTENEKKIVVYNSEKKVSETKTEWETANFSRRLDPAGARLSSEIGLDERRKGLVWFPLYTVDFRGEYAVPDVSGVELPEGAENIELEIIVRLPSGDGTYDAFELRLDDVDLSGVAERKEGALRYRVPIGDSQPSEFAFGYASRGLEKWTYQPLPSQGDAGLIEDFQMVMATDFRSIDFPGGSMSPSAKERTDDGWRLTWSFERILTGQTIGMVMPERVQPGELGAKLSATAPISLGFFTLVLYVLSFLRGHRIHPIHYAFVGAAFFAFHLLFAYTADHLPVEWAFATASLTSMVLVVSYLRLVISNRFAFGPVALAQLIYLVAFGVAHFFAGLTGLAITVLGIVTLFGLMQVTGRIDWFENESQEPPPEPLPTELPA